jgi:hypothetical protein
MIERNLKLLASAVSLEAIAQIIGKYFYSDSPADLRESGDGVYTIYYPKTSKRAGDLRPNYQVRCVKGRYRFEEL